MITETSYPSLPADRAVPVWFAPGHQIDNEETA